MDTEQNIFPADAVLGVGARPAEQVAGANADDAVREAPGFDGARRDRTWFWLLGFAVLLAACLFIYDRVCWSYGIGGHPFLLVIEVTDAETGKPISTATITAFTYKRNGVDDMEEFTAAVDGLGCLSLSYQRITALSDWSGLKLTYNGGARTPACKYKVTAPGYEPLDWAIVPRKAFSLSRGGPPPTQIVRVALRKQ